jgi:hypothetical protein
MLVVLAWIPVAGAGCGESGVCQGATGISAFGDTIAVLKPNGSLWTWTQYQDSIQPKLALASSGAVGFANGQMCLRLFDGSVSCPMLVQGPEMLPSDAQEVSIWLEGGLASGPATACAVLPSSDLTCPVGIYSTVAATGVRRVSASRLHYCVVTVGGQLDCELWNGALGSQSWGASVSSLTDVVEVESASTADRSVARTASGEVWDLTSGATTQIQGIDGPAAQLVAGADFFCALLTDGRVFCWDPGGDQFDLVPPDNLNPSPQQIVKLPGPAIAIAAGPGEGGGEFACALLQDTTVWCWGAGFGGQAGRQIGSCG